MHRKNSQEKEPHIAEALSMEGGGFTIMSLASDRGVCRIVRAGASNGLHIITIETDGANTRHYQLRIIHELGGRTEGYTGLTEAYVGSYHEQAKDDARFASREACRTRDPSVHTKAPPTA